MKKLFLSQFDIVKSAFKQDHFLLIKLRLKLETFISLLESPEAKKSIYIPPR